MKKRIFKGAQSFDFIQQIDLAPGKQAGVEVAWQKHQSKVILT
jgi:hypothetical protein